ncbi:MAG: hypothetical protein AVDCRST_MAG32-1674 [uncultured Nocardioides sp.]|uniref:Uncharacterized protein n=1 Tax=uncultured Nocardioides sp. TaxID=198441 RepID=A0A6J4N969_9ACTN|nr:MAG: hypothetical protein AVDCRST_MAG32-1674 [uncultured Nocardioides sp.]
MKWFIGLVALTAVGLVVQHQTMGPDLTCPNGSVIGMSTLIAGTRGEDSPGGALATAGWEGGARVTEQPGAGNDESIIYRAYDGAGELLRVVEVRHYGRRGWFVGTDEQCDP